MEAKIKNVELIFNDARQEHPRKSGYYICCLNCGTVATLPYSCKHDAFNVRDEYDKVSAVRYSMNDSVAWWAKVPYKMHKQMGVMVK